MKRRRLPYAGNAGQGSCDIIGSIIRSAMSGNSPRMKIAATSIKIGMKRFVFFYGFLFVFGFFPYMTFIRRKMYAVWSTLVNTPIIASQLKLSL